MLMYFTFVGLSIICLFGGLILRICKIEVPWWLVFGPITIVISTVLGTLAFWSVFMFMLGSIQKVFI